MENTLGKRIAEYRKEKGLTQEELAEKLGVSAQAVSKWENDNSCPDIMMLPKLAEIFGITTDELLVGKDDIPEVRLIPADKRKNIDDMMLRIVINSGEGDKLRVNLPLPLVKFGVEAGLELSALGDSESFEQLKNIDFGKIFEMAEKGMIGKLVEIESADGDIVEIVVE